MTEQEERQQIKAKIIEDIDYLKTNENDIRTALVRIFPNREDAMPVDIALNTLKMNNIAYLDTGTIETLKTFYTNVINQFTIIARAFLSDISNKNAQSKLIESAKGFNAFVDSISIKNKSEDINFVLKADGGAGLSQEFNKIYQRINNLVQEQKPLNELQIHAEQDKKELAKKIDELKQGIDNLQSSDAQIEITKMLTQANQLFEKASSSEQLINDEIQKLLQAKEGQIANTLSKQFKEKTDSLKRPIWINFALIFILVISLSLLGLKYIDLLSNPYITNEAYWHALVMVLIIKLPLIFLILFVLNEYTKAKKLFEEYEHKRIMAATLVNNLERLKNELHADEKDLLELIKVPFEKIFDNPVHSIYGDKSGDKNIGLDQLEKITSIIEKMKK